MDNNTAVDVRLCQLVSLPWDTEATFSSLCSSLFCCPSVLPSTLAVHVCCALRIFLYGVGSAFYAVVSLLCFCQCVLTLIILDERESSWRLKMWCGLSPMSLDVCAFTKPHYIVIVKFIVFFMCHRNKKCSETSFFVVISFPLSLLCDFDLNLHWRISALNLSQLHWNNLPLVAELATFVQNSQNFNFLSSKDLIYFFGG